MSREPNLWWSYDPESGGFSALPPGPFLLPALLLALLLSLFRLFRFEKKESARDILGAVVDTAAYKQAKQEYLELQAIFIECNRLGNEMDFYQLGRYRYLQRFKWIPDLIEWDYRD